MKPKYSGPGLTGICLCGHGWEEHHHAVVMNEEYRQATGEAYIPQECEHYGFNEVGGMMLTEDGWVEHCMSYRDSALLPELLTEN